MMPGDQEGQQLEAYLHGSNCASTFVIRSLSFQRRILLNTEQVLLKEGMEFPNIMQQTSTVAERCCSKWFSECGRELCNLQEMLSQQVILTSSVFCVRDNFQFISPQ